MTDTEKCSWVQDSDGTYNSSCGGAFVFNDDGCEENGFNFCCYCGKPSLKSNTLKKIVKKPMKKIHLYGNITAPQWALN